MPGKMNVVSMKVNEIREKISKASDSVYTKEAHQAFKDEYPAKKN